MKKILVSLLCCAILVSCASNYVTVSVDNTYCKGKNYADVVKIFKKRGFTDINTQVDSNATVFPWSKDGEVTEVTIAGKNNYKKDDGFNINDKIVIKYIDKE